MIQLCCNNFTMKKRNIGIVLTSAAVGIWSITLMAWLFMTFLKMLDPELASVYGDVDPARMAIVEAMFGAVVGIISIVCAALTALGAWLIKSAGKEAAVIASWAYVAKAWEITKKNIRLFLKVIAFMVLVNIVLSIPAFMYEENVWIVQMSDLFSSLANIYIEIGFVSIALLLVSGKKADFNALFVSLKPYVNFVIATILYSLIVGLGFILFIIPGIYFGLKYQLFPYFIIDRKAGILASLRLSGLATKGVKLDMLLLGLVLQLLTILALIPLGLGLLVMMPLSVIAWTLVYKKLEAQIK